MIRVPRHISRFLALLGLATVLVWASSGQASADEACEGRRCGFGSSLPDPAIYSGASFEGPGDGTGRPVGGGSSIFAGCTWDILTEGEELLTGRPDVASINIDGSVFSRDHYIIFCPHIPGFGAYTIFPVGDPPPVPIIQDLIRDAYAMTPVVAFNPITSPAGSRDVPLITQLTTFLWVDPAGWATPVTATASLPIPAPGFSVTTTAVPRVATWSGGDTPVVCDGGGMHPYDASRGEDAQPSTCTTVYRDSSAVKENRIDLEVVWDVSYTCSIPICGGPLPDITTVSSRPVVVAELQAIGIANP